MLNYGAYSYNTADAEVFDRNKRKALCMLLSVVFQVLVEIKPET